MTQNVLTDRDSILITAEALAEQLRTERALHTEPPLPAEPPRTRLLDVRWSLPQPDGRAAFAEGHIPGAVYVDLDTELARHGDTHDAKNTQDAQDAPTTHDPRDGRHPLPHPAQFQAAARSWGLREQDQVVAYDGGGNLAAARVWWLLRNAGFERVRLLDGALPAWAAAGYPLETGASAPTPGDVTLDPGQLATLDLADVAEFVASGGTLLDARATERFTGETEPIDPRAGHIPGARSAPTTGNLDGAGRFLDGAALRERFAGAGVTDDSGVAAYCGSGITASHTVVALALAGYDAALFPGSWSQWSNHAELPVATGP